MSTFLIIVVILLPIAACFIPLILPVRWVDKKEQAAMAERRRLIAALKSLDYSCDGRSLTITRSPEWDESMYAAVTVSPQLRQVFHISVPGHEPLRTIHLVEDGLSRDRESKLPEAFDQPLTVTPFVFDPWTADQVRRDKMPYLAARMNLDQTAIDATVIELVGHELRYFIAYDYERIGKSPFVDYRPASS